MGVCSLFPTQRGTPPPRAPAGASPPAPLPGASPPGPPPGFALDPPGGFAPWTPRPVALPVIHEPGSLLQGACTPACSVRVSATAPAAACALRMRRWGAVRSVRHGRRHRQIQPRVCLHPSPSPVCVFRPRTGPRPNRRTPACSPGPAVGPTAAPLTRSSQHDRGAAVAPAAPLPRGDPRMLGLYCPGSLSRAI